MSTMLTNGRWLKQVDNQKKEKMLMRNTDHDRRFVFEFSLVGRGL